MHSRVCACRTGDTLGFVSLSSQNFFQRNSLCILFHFSTKSVSSLTNISAIVMRGRLDKLLSKLVN